MIDEVFGYMFLVVGLAISFSQFFRGSELIFLLVLGIILSVWGGFLIIKLRLGRKRREKEGG